MADTPKVVFVTKRSPRHQQAALAAAPEGVRVSMLYRPARADLLTELADADVLISERAGVVDAAMIAAAPRLRLIQRLGSLVHDVDLAAAQQADVAVCTRAVTGCMMMAEHMLMQMLALTKRLPVVSRSALEPSDRSSRRTDENTFAFNWTRRTDVGGLVGRTVGIWGFGETGAELARRLAAFGPAQVLYYKRRRLPASVEAALDIVYAEPDAMLPVVDCLCVLLPYSAATDLLLDAATFAAMRPGAMVVSCGSGSVIDETALAAAVQTGHLAGAALDTYEWEPPLPDNPLVALGRDPAMNVLLTPHTAASTQGGGGRQGDWTNVRRWLAGESLLNRVV